MHVCFVSGPIICLDAPRWVLLNEVSYFRVHFRKFGIVFGVCSVSEFDLLSGVLYIFLFEIFAFMNASSVSFNFIEFVFVLLVYECFCWTSLKVVFVVKYRISHIVIISVRVTAC